ncbi:hypothetical protein GYH30_040405 [Glycine max]|nr:hypothetical protein GYH30_040405 [Glycine max]
MAASSASTQGCVLPITSFATELVEFNGKCFAPSPGLEAETKKLWKTQVMIPLSLAEKQLAFAGPFKLFHQQSPSISSQVPRKKFPQSMTIRSGWIS